MTKPNFTPSNHVVVQPGDPIPTTNDTHVELAAGRHRLTSDIQASSLQRYKMTGQGEDTIIETDGTHKYLLSGRFVDGPVEVGNFVVDYGPEEHTSGAGINLIIKDGFHLHDVRWDGFTPREGSGDDWKCMVRINDPTGDGYIERVESVGPSHIDGHRDGKGMGILNDEHKGTMHFRDIYVENCPGDAPWYTSGLGRCIYERMYMVNNAMANIRMGGNSEVYDSVLVQDHGREPDNTGSYDACNAFLVAGQLGSHVGTHIENVDIIHSNLTGSGTIFRTHQTTGEVTVKDVRVRVDDGKNSLFLENWYGQSKYPNKYEPPADMSWDFDGFHVTGSLSLGTVFDMESARSGSDLTNSCISASYNRLSSNGVPKPSGLSSDSCDPATEHDPRIARPFGAEPDESMNRSVDQTTDTETTSTMNTITINGNGSARTWYHIRTETNVDPGTAANLNDPTVDPYADKQLDPQEIVGCVGPGGTDTWSTEGSVSEMALVGGAGEVLVNGEPVTDVTTISEPHVPAVLADGWSSGIKEYADQSTDESTDTSGDSGSGAPTDSTSEETTTSTDSTTDSTQDTTTEATLPAYPAEQLTDAEVQAIKRMLASVMSSQ